MLKYVIAALIALTVAACSTICPIASFLPGCPTPAPTVAPSPAP